MTSSALRLKYLSLTLALLLTGYPFVGALNAQSEEDRLVHTIFNVDSLFWQAYNHCDVDSMRNFFTDDIEFYHDKGGLTVGNKDLTASLSKNLCGNESFRLRRVAVPGTVKVFPLKNADVFYGAIISGEHLFYVIESGKDERLDGQAKFTNVWILNGQWRMSRTLSYDHGPAPYVNQRKPVQVSRHILNQFAGRYLAPHAGLCEVKTDGLLNLFIDNKKYALYPQSNNSFFVKDRDLTLNLARF
jgi:hypothetical protein